MKHARQNGQVYIMYALQTTFIDVGMNIFFKGAQKVKKPIFFIGA